MSYRPFTLVLALGVPLLVGCSDNGSNGGDGGVTGKMGTLRIKVDYSGTLTKDAKVVAALMGCPWVMPPTAYGDFPITSEKMEGELPNIPAGEYCSTAFIDMVPGDGGSSSGWVQAVDPAAVVDPTDPPIKVTIEAGKTTDVTMTFSMKPTTDAGPVDSGPDGAVADSHVTSDGSVPGPNDVWVEVTVNCPTCKTGGSFVLYGNLGPALPTAFPELYNKVPDPTWPLTALLKDTTPPMQPSKPFPAAEVTVKGYHDADGLNPMGPDPDEPVSDPTTITLQKGVLNKLTLDLKL